MLKRKLPAYIIIFIAIVIIFYNGGIVGNCKDFIKYTYSIYGGNSNKQTNNINISRNSSNNGNETSTQSKEVTNVSKEEMNVTITGYTCTASNYNEYYNEVKKAMENFDDSVTIKINNYTSSVYNLGVVNKVLDDYYDIDYGIDGASGTIYSNSKEYIIKINFKYKLPRSEMLSMRDSSIAEAKKVLSQIIKPKMTDLKKELAIHDYIVNNTSYDYNNYLKGTIPEKSYTDYGVLVSKRAVCEGYSKAMFRLLSMEGIQCYVVKGTVNGEGHAWNIVKIDGKYTQVDATFDDPVMSNGSNVLRHNYFDISDYQMAKDHQWDNSKYPQCIAISYK